MYDDGVLYICNLDNVAENGMMPRQVLKIQNKYWFEQRTVGINRSYLAKGVNQQVDLLLRIHFDNNIAIGQYAVLGNGSQYHIDNVQHYKGDSTYYSDYDLRYTEITLSRLESYYAVETE